MPILIYLLRFPHVKAWHIITTRQATFRPSEQSKHTTDEICNTCTISKKKQGTYTGHALRAADASRHARVHTCAHARGESHSVFPSWHADPQLAGASRLDPATPATITHPEPRRACQVAWTKHANRQCTGTGPPTRTPIPHFPALPRAGSNPSNVPFGGGLFQPLLNILGQIGRRAVAPARVF